MQVTGVHLTSHSQLLLPSSVRARYCYQFIRSIQLIFVWPTYFVVSRRYSNTCISRCAQRLQVTGQSGRKEVTNDGSQIKYVVHILYIYVYIWYIMTEQRSEDCKRNWYRTERLLEYHFNTFSLPCFLFIFLFFSSFTSFFYSFFLSFLNEVVVQDSATGWSLVQRSPTDCGASLCVIKKPRGRGGHSLRWAAEPEREKKN
jgi:hypothetical protein